MQTPTPDLVQSIHARRNTSQPSEVLLHHETSREDGPEAIGVLLLKPSSGYFPPATIQEILDRLVGGHSYRMTSVTWWNGRDMREFGLMSLHYPGFHRVGHGGLASLSPQTAGKLRSAYGATGGSGDFDSAFGVPFDPGLVTTPYDLVEQGVSPERLNELWEIDRSADPDPLKRIQRLDEDAFALALRLPKEDQIPSSLRGKVVILLNGFYAKLEKDFEAHGCVAIRIQKPASSSTSWEMLRSNYAGKTNPSQAPQGTIRGDAARGTLRVETVSILANVIHLSATEAEGSREVSEVWWEPLRFAKVFGSSDSKSAEGRGGKSTRLDRSSI